MWNASDEALLAGFATGDPDAAVAFVRRFQARVFGLAVSMTREPKAAEEVAQDTFVRAWRYAASFDPRRGSVAGWLLGITRNLAFDQLRSARQRDDRVVLEEPDALRLEDLVAGHADIAADWAERRDDAARIARALGQLSEPQRQAILAVTVGGCTAQEHASDADIPLGTAKTRVRLGLRKLRDVLEVRVE